jgi:hypothetical protein
MSGSVRALSALVLFALASCLGTFRLVTPYDEVLDYGLSDYRERLNAFARDVADKAGKPEGTFDANKPRYNELESKVDGLVARARLQGGMHACRLPAGVLQEVLALAGAELPPEVKRDPPPADGNAFGCTVRLLELVHAQLGLLMQIHAQTDKCAGADGTSLSCLRPATAQTALRISNQSIDAALIVETAKRKGSGD